MSVTLKPLPGGPSPRNDCKSSFERSENERWLLPHRQAEGKVCEYANISKQLMWLTETVDANLKEQDPKTGFAWKHNALRHSFISYRVAQIQNVAQVALEAGNSPRMVFSNYRELVRTVDAEKWFGITPEAVAAAKDKPENVVQLRDQVAAA